MAYVMAADQCVVSCSFPVESPDLASYTMERVPMLVLEAMTCQTFLRYFHIFRKANETIALQYWE